MRAVSPLAALCIACASVLALADEPAKDEATQEPGDAAKLSVTWVAPQPLRGLFEKYLPPPRAEPGEGRRASLRPWIRDVRRRVPEIAAAEGYFAAKLDIEFDPAPREHATVTVDPGPLTKVSKIDITFKGDIAGEGPEREKRREQVRADWSMAQGAPFRSADWEVAKTKIVESLSDEDYAAAKLSASRAEVDTESSQARLAIVLDSGPPFTTGDVTVAGLEAYPEAVVRRLVDFQRGERYSRARLEDLQRLIQTGPWFSSVVIDIERDPLKPNMVPVRITVTERPQSEIGLAVGYGTDDGARVETAYRYRNLFRRGFDVQSSARVAQEQQIGYVDVYLPPGLWASRHRGDIPYTDSVGVLAEHNTIQNLAFSRFAVAGYRHWKLDRYEFRAGLSYQIERSYPEGSEPQIKRALAPIAAVTWRTVDNLFDPRRGGVLNVQVAAGAKSLASGDDFVKLYAQYQLWIPLGANDQLLLRTEIGETFVPSRDHLPEDFLYRAGGSRSNRGYAFQSLGVQEGNAVVGGRFLGTGTAEYVHWLNEKWGGALFFDVGEATDTPKEWEALRSYGVGARYKTPAGPLALDLAYAERDRKFRIAFSVTVAF